MKRLIFSLILALCILGQVVPCHAAVTGSVSLANSRLSLVDGTAFVDFSAAGTLTPYLGWKLKICDSTLPTSKCIVGYIRSAGTGETLGDELLSDPAFDDDAGTWTAQSGWAVAGGKATATASSMTIYQTANVPAVGKCLVVSATCDSSTSGTYKLRYGGKYEQVASGTGTKTRYVTGYGDGDSVGILGASLTASFTDISLKQVLTPSATGATITSTRGGTTYNWASIESGFNYNDSAGYTYTIVPRFVGGGLGMGIIYGF